MEHSSNLKNGKKRVIKQLWKLSKKRILYENKKKIGENENHLNLRICFKKVKNFFWNYFPNQSPLRLLTQG